MSLMPAHASLRKYSGSRLLDCGVRSADLSNVNGVILLSMPAGIEKRRFTADEYQAMGLAGILSEDDRVELIDGEILVMTPISAAHAAAVNRANRALVRAAGDAAIVSPQNPVRLNLFNEPQPDLVLFRPRDDFYRTTHPLISDVLLVIEIAHSSLRYDRDVKTALYARHAVVEYWLVHLESGTLTRYTSPGDGAYRETAVHARGERMAPRALPDCVISVDDLI
jgi:Uma2 family endonuclease